MFNLSLNLSLDYLNLIMFDSCLSSFILSEFKHKYLDVWLDSIICIPNPNTIFDSVKVSLWKEVSFHMGSESCFFLLWTLSIKNENKEAAKAAQVTRLKIKARGTDEPLLDLLGTELHEVRFSSRVSAHSSGLFKKLTTYARFSNLLGILPIKWLEERFRLVSKRWANWVGIWPDSWFSDKSSTVRSTKLPISSGIFLES